MIDEEEIDPSAAYSLRWYRALFDAEKSAQIAFMASVDNVSVSLSLSNPETDVLPIRMWSMLESTLDVRTAAVSGVLIATAAVFVFVMDRAAGLTRRLT